MERMTLKHLDREWEVSILGRQHEDRRVRFRSSDAQDSQTFEARVQAEEVEDPDPIERELALRRALEASLVLHALEGQEDGLTADQVARRTGMPPEAVEDRCEVLDSVQLVPQSGDPRRYRILILG